MYKGKKVICIIPARGGSKRIPNKNIATLAGKPMIWYTISEAKKCSAIDRVFVSTNDEHIAKISQGYGAEIIRRPKQLAADNSNTLDAIKHVLRHLEEHEGYTPEVIVQLQPTSPLRKVKHISEALNLFFDKNADTVLSVVHRKLGPQWILKRTGERLGWLNDNDFSKIRTQEQEECFELNGAVNIYSREVVLKSKVWAFGNRVYPLIMGKIESIDVDEPSDLRLAEVIIKNGIIG